MHARAFSLPTFQALTPPVQPPRMEQQHPSPSCLTSSQAAGKRNLPLGFGVLLPMLPQKDGLEAGERRLPQEAKLHPSYRQDTSVPRPCRLLGPSSASPHHR